VRVVLTRELGKNDEARTWFPGGVDIVEVPLTTTSYFPIDEVLRQLQSSPDYGSFTVMVVTSARTADYVHAALASMVEGADLLTVGQTTTRALRERGITVSAEATTSAVELEGVITRGPVLVVGAVVMQEELTDGLRSRGISVTKVACYETLPVELDETQISLLRAADVVLIGAPSAWSIARDHVNEKAWVVVPGGTTKRVVAPDHPRVIEGWGPSLSDIVPHLAT
jgi:uroporphyrinogen-III synthase